MSVTEIEWTNEHGDTHAGPLETSTEQGDVIHCRTCGFLHVTPLPSPGTLRRLYEEHFYQEDKSDYLDRAREDEKWLRLMFDLRLNRISKLLGGADRPRILDIGCGPGDFLAACQDRGWQGTGIEPSPVATAFCQDRGLNVRQGFFGADTAAEMGTFDAVHMSEVLEHIADPQEVLKAAHGILRDGGVLAVSTPNDYNPFQETLVTERDFRQWWVVPDHHLNYFTFSSLEALILTCGFTPVARTTNFPMEMFLLMGQDYTSDPKLGRQLHGWRKSFDLTLAANQSESLEAYYDSLAAAGLGRLTIVFAQKSDPSGGPS
jgi:SAM-dependent methyltransferase